MSVNDVWICLIAFYLLSGGKAGGAGQGGEVVVGLGDVLPVFISSCLFGCALGFYFFIFLFLFLVGNSCENVASKIRKKNVQNVVKKPKLKTKS